MSLNTGNDLPQEFVFYLSDFNKLWKITVDAINKVNSHKYNGDYLYQLIAPLDRIATIDSEDVVQELACIWLKAIQNYNDSKPNCSIRQYLVRMSVWGIRDWLYKEANIPMSGPLIKQEEEREYPFALDLSFLVDGSSQVLFKDLTDYERYLIYLKYHEGKHIFEIAEHLQKDRSVISKQLYAIHDKLRSIFNEDAS